MTVHNSTNKLNNHVVSSVTVVSCLFRARQHCILHLFSCLSFQLGEMFHASLSLMLSITHAHKSFMHLWIGSDLTINANLTNNIGNHQKAYIEWVDIFLIPFQEMKSSHLIKFICFLDLLRIYMRIHCDCTSKQMLKCNIT